MLKKIVLRNYKCFKKFTLDFDNINLLVGKNNIGKTALLTAINLLFSNKNSQLVDTLNLALNSNLTSSTLQLLFYKFNSENPIEIEGKINDSTLKFSIFDLSNNNKDLDLVLPLDSKYLFKWEYSNVDKKEKVSVLGENNKFFVLNSDLNFELKKAIYYSSFLRINFDLITEFFGKIVATGKKEIFLTYLKEIFEEVDNVEIANPSGGSVVCVKFKNDNVLYPIFLIGEGFYKVFAIISLFIYFENGIVMFDEIENGIHFSILTDYWEMISKLSKEFKVQLFATTHSFEFLQVMGKSKQNNGVNVIRLESLEDEIVPIIIKKEIFNDLIKFGHEIR